MSKDDGLKLAYTLTKPVRVSWPNVFELRTPQFDNGQTGKPQYNARFVFPADSTDWVHIKRAALQILRKLDPQLDPKTTPPQTRMPNGRVVVNYWWPFKSGATMITEAKARAAKNGKAYGGWEDYMEGCDTLLAKAYAKYVPQIHVRVNGKWAKANKADHEDLFYNGMMAYGEVQLVGSKNPKNEYGVSCYLNGIGAFGGERIGRSEMALPEPTVEEENAALGIAGALADRLAGVDSSEGFDLGDDIPF